MNPDELVTVIWRGPYDGQLGRVRVTVRSGDTLPYQVTRAEAESGHYEIVEPKQLTKSAAAGDEKEQS